MKLLLNGQEHSIQLHSFHIQMLISQKQVIWLYVQSMIPVCSSQVYFSSEKIIHYQKQANYSYKKSEYYNKKNRTCGFFIFYSKLSVIFLATYTPLALACDNECVTPEQSPITYKPLCFVSRLLSTSTSML